MLILHVSHHILTRFHGQTTHTIVYFVYRTEDYPRGSSSAAGPLPTISLHGRPANGLLLLLFSLTLTRLFGQKSKQKLQSQGVFLFTQNLDLGTIDMNQGHFIENIVDRFDIPHRKFKTVLPTEYVASYLLEGAVVSNPRQVRCHDTVGQH